MFVDRFGHIEVDKEAISVDCGIETTRYRYGILNFLEIWAPLVFVDLVLVANSRLPNISVKLFRKTWFSYLILKI